MAKLRKSGGYRQLASFQTATLIYDSTYWFCEKFLDPRSRTVDQMIQAARSGRQNITEGSRASATSSQTELRLVNVARASQEELLLDYEDYLRHRRLPLWEPDSPEASAVRSVPRRFKKHQSDPTNLTDLTDRQRWELYSGWLAGQRQRGDPGKRGHLPDSSGELSTGSANRRVGKAVHRGRRLQRTTGNCPSGQAKGRSVGSV